MALEPPLLSKLSVLYLAQWLLELTVKNSPFFISGPKVRACPELAVQAMEGKGRDCAGVKKSYSEGRARGGQIDHG